MPSESFQFNWIPIGSFWSPLDPFSGVDVGRCVEVEKCGLGFSNMETEQCFGLFVFSQKFLHWRNSPSLPPSSWSIPSLSEISEISLIPQHTLLPQSNQIQPWASCWGQLSTVKIVDVPTCFFFLVNLVWEAFRQFSTVPFIYKYCCIAQKW